MIARNLLIDHLSELQSMWMAESYGRYGTKQNLEARRDLVQAAIAELDSLEPLKKKLKDGTSKK
jgi:hypothetical protein